MSKGIWLGWWRDILGWANWLSYWAVLIFGLALPFFLYCASSFENYGKAPRTGIDTTIVTIWWVTFAIIGFLVVGLASSLFRTPTLTMIIRKLTVSAQRGRGLIVPLALSGIAFYGPILVLAWSNNLGSRRGDEYIVATPLIQSSYGVYLVVLSVAALVRYFFVTSSVQTGASGFIRNVTTDLKGLLKDEEGRLTISLPWLCFGKLSLDPDLFDEFRSALQKCLTHHKIDVEVYTLNPSTLRRGANKSIADPTNRIDSKDIKEFLNCELELRRLGGARIKMPKQEDLVGCVIVNEKIYAVHLLLHKAQKYGDIGDLVLSMEIHDAGICAEYRKRLKLISL